MLNNPEQENDKKTEEFYTSFREKLQDTHNFPEDYLFKFIVPSDESKLTEIYRVFDDIKFALTTRDSKTGKYTSVTIDAFVLDADQVIRIYKEVGKISGVIML